MIEANDLGRRFGDRIAVDRLSLRVPPGAVLGLLGPNGAGKTTTVRMLAGLLAPTSGTATVAGHDVRADPAGVRARVGLVTEAPGLYEQMTLPAYLDFFGSLYGLAGPIRRRRIDELLAFFELDGRRREKLVGFSRGMKQKVALARALLHKPAVLFLDEPTAGLDPLAARGVRDLIVSLTHASRTIVLCTHDLDEAERLADEVVIIRRGRVVAADAPGSLRARASSDAAVRITLATPCPGALATVAALDGVEAASLGRDDAPDRAATTLAYRTPDPERVNPEVIARLVAAGARIVAVTSEMRTLEDVYAAAIGEDEPPDTRSAPDTRALP